MGSSHHVLVIGAGELGREVLNSLIQHPKRHGVTVSVLLRPASLYSDSISKQGELNSLRQSGIHIAPGDIVQDEDQDLASLFESYHTIISCMGFTSGRGTQTKLTRAVLAARTPQYIPWQFGVDYDTIGRGSSRDVFDELLDVRDILRSQDTTRWAVISTGMFTSFLFEPGFGVVDVDDRTVCALGSWENRVTVTTPEDIRRMTAEIVLGGESDALFSDGVVFIGGDTISYGELAELVEEVVGKPFRRTVLTVEDVKNALARDPENGLHKYQVVFSQGRGVAWDLAETWNQQRGISLTTARDWAMDNLV